MSCVYHFTYHRNHLETHARHVSRQIFPVFINEPRFLSPSTSHAALEIIFTNSHSHGPSSVTVTPTSHHGLHKQLVAGIRLLNPHVICKGPNIIYQWMHGHCGITGNARDDEAARSAYDCVHGVAVALSRIDAAKTNTGVRAYTGSQWNSTEFSNTHLHSLGLRLHIGV